MSTTTVIFNHRVGQWMLSVGKLRAVYLLMLAHSQNNPGSIASLSLIDICSVPQSPATIPPFFKDNQVLQ